MCCSPRRWYGALRHHPTPSRLTTVVGHIEFALRCWCAGSTGGWGRSWGCWSGAGRGGSCCGGRRGGRTRSCSSGPSGGRRGTARGGIAATRADGKQQYCWKKTEQGCKSPMPHVRLPLGTQVIRGCGSLSQAGSRSFGAQPSSPTTGTIEKRATNL